ncbi:MAG: ATP-dependent protease ATPase subunit HslU [Fusobacterium sp. JB021]|nr:ATP-dependent protease ATPase subunit HslU [Fusobacterium sp. JB020]MDP0493462.1 ATP-dependent protease ATPase subunit HslU [Fusobacterium sp. JB021]MDP0507081.1 ATP-dependent protease ATPase subunit HslU [Fusobacterium sp. JB019]
MIEKNLVPKIIVKELDKYIVSQDEAKKNVAVSLRNRYRRKLIKNEIMKKEITPKNIILMGSTGVGKTEIARRLAKITNSPFIKVEATKYTEVGYVGKDVESIIKDLVAITIRKLRKEKIDSLKDKYMDFAIEKVAKKLDKLSTINDESKEKLINEIKEGIYDDREVEINKPIKRGNTDGAVVEVIGNKPDGDMGPIIESIMSNFDGKKSKKVKVTVKDAIDIIINEEIEKNINMDEINIEAVRAAEEDGIIFIDEIDKIAGSGNVGRSEVSRQGVQRDILPIVEGTTVMTKYGPVKTDHILFIAAGAFSESSFSDLMPELQGRFPIVTEMQDLNEQDFKKILTNIDYNLIDQYREMLLIDNVELKVTKGAIEKISEYAIYLNENIENIGARRLSTILEFLLKDIMFEAPYEGKEKITIDKKYVEKIFKGKFKEENLDKYIL